MTLARKKISVIHVAKAKLSLSDEDYRAILWRAGGVESSRDLDQLGFEAVMATFARLGFESDFQRSNFGDRPGMATAQQVAFIRQLWHEYTDGQGTDRSLGKWLERTFKVSAVRFIPAETAPKAITGLLKMTRRKQAKAGKPGDGQ